MVAIEAVSEAKASLNDFDTPMPFLKRGKILKVYPKINARNIDKATLAVAPHTRAVDIIMPNISPIAQPVRQCSVALAAVLFNEV